MRLRVLGHPLHPTLTDFPIVLWLAGLPLVLAGLARGGTLWWTAAFWSVAAGCGIALLTAISGFIDYLALPRDHPAERVAFTHLLVMLAAFSVFGCALLAQGGARAPGTPRVWFTVALLGAGSLLVIIGGWFGGHLVFRYAVGQDQGWPGPGGGRGHAPEGEALDPRATREEQDR